VLDGYRVDLAQLEDYTQALVDTQLLYDQIEDQLTEADLTSKDPTFGSLIGHPQYAGPQSDFTESCRTFLTTYRDLYSQIHALNHQISGKLNYMVQAFVDTREQYQKLENDHAAVFDGLLDRIRGGGHDDSAGPR
jgi:hypothetical protein